MKSVEADANICVDRLLTESNEQAAEKVKKQGQQHLKVNHRSLKTEYTIIYHSILVRHSYLHSLYAIICLIILD